MPDVDVSIPVEWNPFRPDIPSHLADVDGGLYDYLREQAELIREQHNSTQAGDSTFPWQMFVTPGDRKVHSLGSVTRFVHETYGLFLARYVQFSANWTTALNPLVGHDKARGDWIATNQAAKTNLFRVIGFAAPYYSSLASQYGWVLTQGRGTFPITLISETEPAQFARFTWSPEDDGLALIGPGPQVGILLGIDFEEVGSFDPPHWTIPAGAWYADVQGVTPEYTALTASVALADLTDRVTSLEGGVPPDYALQLAAIEASIAGLTSNLGFESATRASADAGLNTRVGILEALGIGGFVTFAVFDALELRVDSAEAGLVGVTSSLSALSVSTDMRLDNLESWQVTATSQIIGLTTTVAGKASPADITAAISAHEAAADPHPGYTTPAELTTALGSYLTTAAAAASYQPLDSDLSAIAALATTVFGRSLLTLAALPNPSYLTTTVDLGVTGVDSGNFTIAGAGMTIGKPVHIWQAADEEAEFDQILATGIVESAILIRVYWRATDSVSGSYTFNYLVGA